MKPSGAVVKRFRPAAPAAGFHFIPAAQLDEFQDRFLVLLNGLADAAPESASPVENFGLLIMPLAPLAK